MKRDMDLVREILLQVEAHEKPRQRLDIVSGAHTEEQVNFHCRLLKEAGLAEVIVSEAIGGPLRCQVLRLTWQGYDFLDSIRDPEIWEKTKSGAKIVGAWSVDMLTQLAKAYVKQVVKEKLGIDLG